ncbi:RNA-directed DNA polymerase, eukaryota [Tanacetum coccineum]|uniref:RNA-directed DNA polymerase, eukaryota n=1 Tax=Tanacetum coccineum TaxID=301880 RepID=A0ABQ4ZZB0_9ASTR
MCRRRGKVNMRERVERESVFSRLGHSGARVGLRNNYNFRQDKQREHGNLVDIYMAKNRLRNGSRIRGFMTNTGSQDRMEADRRQTRAFDGDRKYEKVEKANTVKHTSTETRSIKFSAAKEHEVYLESSIIGSAKDVEILDSIGDICDAEGLEDFETKLLGGLEILFKCRNKMVAERIINDKQHRLHQWFENIRRWDEQWQQSKRVCWIKVQGVSANGWTENVFRQIAEEWGDPHEFENCNFFDSTDLSFGRVLIVTKYWEKINSNKNMRINGLYRLIRIMEDDCIRKPSDQCLSESGKTWSEKMVFNDNEEVEQHRDTEKEKQKVQTESLQKEVENEVSGYGDNTRLMEEEVQATAVKKDAVKSNIEKPTRVVSLMKTLSLNIRGLGSEGKVKWVKELIAGEKPMIMGLQETKKDRMEENEIQYIWGSDSFGFAKVDAIGSAGGVLTIWDNSWFFDTTAMGEEGFVAVVGSWKGKDGLVGFINVYAP